MSDPKQNPALSAQAVIASDTVDLPAITTGLYVGETGNVAVILAGGDTSVIFVAVPAGTILPIQCKRVKSTGTTATSIVALF